MMERRTFLRVAAGATLAAAADIRLLSAREREAVLQATVTIDAAREVGRIDPMVYGHQLEHLERVVYGGVFDPSSPYADATGLRQDVVQAVKEMGGARVIRWPGGNFVSNYHWTDGIGPRNQRPRRLDLAWGTYESNHFGTDEFLALCRDLECEPFINTNMGSGSLLEATRWVEYTRREGRQPPARIWGLGNEHFGAWQVGHYTAEEYGRMAAQYARFMRVVEPDLRFVGVGGFRVDSDWNETVLRHIGDRIEWLSHHVYGHRYHHEGVDDFDQAVATPAIFERDLRVMADQITHAERTLARTEPLRICLEEWNTRHSVGGRLRRESPRNIGDALFIAGVFNACHRLSERVTMTNYIFLVNAHAPIEVTPTSLLRSATFDVYRLYGTRMQPVAVATEVETEQFTATLPPSTMAGKQNPENNRVTTARLDASATRSVDGRSMAIALLNLDRSRPARVALAVRGRRLPPTGTIHTLSAPGVEAVNTLDHPDVVRAVTRTLGRTDAIELPPHSVNVVELELAT
jgi:alpha-L-arabinofuranosidase